MVGVVYADSSALAKLIVEEEHSPAVRARVADRIVVSSLIARVEVARAAARQGVSAEAAAALDDWTYVVVDAEIAEIAAGIAPPALRSMDAIHVATALALAPDLDAFITYDQRQAAAAVAAGLNVESPGRDAP